MPGADHYFAEGLVHHNSGKTYAGARWIGDLAANTPGLRARIIAPTLSDAVNSVVLDPQSGIVAAHADARLRTSGPEGTRVVWPNGSTVWCVGTPTPRDVDRLRALTNIDADLFEEAAANPQLEAAVKQAGLSRRGNRLVKPLWIATSTPRPLPTIRHWFKGGESGETVAVTRATTHDNPYTPDAYRQHAEQLKGTRLYRQEVLGEILDDVEGALWTQADLDRSRIAIDDRPRVLDDLTRIMVGVDPPSGSGTCGIVVAGIGTDLHLYVLDDYSLTDVSPNEWASAVIQAVADYPGATVVAEINQGGRMVAEVLRAADKSLAISTVNAAQGKRTRAEPIALLWEADLQSAHMAGANLAELADLETQMTEWVPGEFSPDRVDALVWACTYLRKHAGVATLHRATGTAPTRARVGGSLAAMRRGAG